MKKGTFDENVGHFFQHMLMENLIALKCTKSNDKYRKFHFNQERTDVINWILSSIMPTPLLVPTQSTPCRSA